MLIHHVALPGHICCLSLCLSFVISCHHKYPRYIRTSINQFVISLLDSQCSGQSNPKVNMNSKASQQSLLKEKKIMMPRYIFHSMHMSPYAVCLCTADDEVFSFQALENILTVCLADTSKLGRGGASLYLAFIVILPVHYLQLPWD